MEEVDEALPVVQEEGKEGLVDRAAREASSVRTPNPGPTHKPGGVTKGWKSDIGSLYGRKDVGVSPGR